MKRASKHQPKTSRIAEAEIDPDLEIPEVPDAVLREAIRAGRGRYAGRIERPYRVRIFDSEAGITPEAAPEIVLEPSARADPAV